MTQSASATKSVSGLRFQSATRSLFGWPSAIDSTFASGTPSRSERPSVSVSVIAFESSFESGSATASAIVFGLLFASGY